MTEKPIDRYIKSPPPSDKRSHYQYLEDQLSKLENVSNSHVIAISDSSATAKALVTQEMNARVSGDEAQAQYTLTVAAQTLNSASALVQQEVTARTTADTALASSITTLNANVGTLSGSITNEASLRITADEALGTRIDNLVLTNGSDAAVIIDEEASARITADYALGVRIDSLTATVGTNTSAISTEQTARSTRDDALAKQLFTMSSGSARIYIATSAPGSTGRQAGDVWFDSSTANNYKPYVWARATPSATSGAYDWRDNSDGSFTNLVGNYAVYTQAISTLTTASTSQASSITALQTTVGDSTAGLVKDVTALTTTVGNSSSGLVKDVTTLQSTTAQQRIFRQATMPSTATADRKVGDLWFDTSNNNAPYYWNGTGWIANPDNTRASVAALTTEQTARTTADTALASYLMIASAGTSRVYTSDPGTSGRQNGDVWIKPEENFRQYVWYNSAWRDNGSGSYSQYIGLLASVTTTANAAYSTSQTAQTAASSATAIAQQATSTANSASSTANNASSAASTAQSIASTAQSVANTAKSTADSASATANQANSTAASAAYQASQLSTTVSDNYYTLNSKIDSVNATLTTRTDSLATSINTVSSTVNGYSSSISTLQTTTASINGALSNQWAIVGSLGGPSNNIVTLTGIRKSDGSTTPYLLRIAANTEIEGNLLVKGSITTDQYGNSPIASNAVSSSGYAFGTGSASTSVTVRPGARVQVLANVKSSSSYTSIQWAPVGNNVNNGTYVLVNGSWQVKNLSDYTPSSTVSSKATLRISTPAGNDDTDILGAYNGSINDVQIGATVINGVLCAIYERRYTTMIYATTGITSWYNSGVDSTTFTFTAQSITTGATVNLYVIELSK